MIDFSKLPVDTLVDCDFLGDIQTLLFKGIDERGQYYKVSSTPEGVSQGRYFTDVLAEKIRISAKNPWLPWFGGECPVPNGCVVNVQHRSAQYSTKCAELFEWDHLDLGLFDMYDCEDIIAYHLIESPWQTISGVCDE